MLKRFRSVFHVAILVLLSSAVIAQTQVSGRVTDAGDGETLAGVSIVVKGRVIGTISDIDGNFSLKINEAPPLTLSVSFVGYRTVEVSISEATTSGLEIKLEEQTILGQEIVVSASRVEQPIMESVSSVEKMDILAIQSTASHGYYNALATMKGVDMTTSSINFQIINARGFGSTGNTRFVQLMDGMDTQAPALNFPIGNLNGPSELDVESVEMIPGASSALYGPNAFNGMILITSKNPFDYQGASGMAKLGFNHIGGNADFDGPSPVYDGAFRYAKAFNNRFAFKINGAYMRAEDWHGTDDYDREKGRTPAGFSFNPGADRLHYMGDEAAINLAIFPFSVTTDASNPGWDVLAQGPLGTFAPGITAWRYAQNNWLPNHVVSITPFEEQYVVDYGAENFKLNGGLYYRLNDKLELSYIYNGGFGTSVYTGAQRYSLANFSIQQHRLQLRADNFYLRAYTTRENSGDSYIAEFLAKRLNDKRAGSVSTWLGTYAVYYLRYLYDNGYNDPDENVSVPISVQELAHQYARTQTDNRYPLTPGTDAFDKAKAQALEGVVPFGPKFKDATNLYHAELQYDFKNDIKFMELLAGGSYRVFDLNSNGTIFADLDENITITEYGAYVQAAKWLAHEKIKLSGSVRYDKNLNFKGRVNPRISALFKAGENHNFRASYQTGFRIPSTQGQHIDLNVLSARLLGGLPRYAEKYDIVRTSSVDNSKYLSFEGTSVQDFRSVIFGGGTLPEAVAELVPFTKFNPVKPEQVRAIEVGYRGLIKNNLFMDFSYYYNIYNDFITNVVVVTAKETPSGDPNYLTILNGTYENTYSIYTNAPGQVTAQGAVAGVSYNLPRHFSVSANYNWNQLGDVPAGFIAEYNTPEHKVNLSVANRKVTEELGFNVTWRWQSAFDWQSSFTQYTLYPVPAYNTLDAQVSYRVPSIKSVVKLGGSNILNNKYIQSGGGPNISGLYYLSITFDQLMN